MKEMSEMKLNFRVSRSGALHDECGRVDTEVSKCCLTGQIVIENKDEYKDSLKH